MRNNASKKIAPSRKWYWLSVFLFLIGPLISAFLLYSIFSAAIHTTTFYVPGQSQVYITKPGHYTLWTESKIPNIAEKLTHTLGAANITFTNATTGKSFLFKPSMGWRDTRNNSTHYSLGTIKFARAGNYQVNAVMPESAHYKVYLRQPSLLRVLTALALGFFLTFLSIVSAILSAIIILIKRINATNIMATNEQKTIPTTPETPTPQETTWAMVCHLSGFAGFIFPFGNLIAPLLVWAIKREKSPYVDEQGKEAINFQLSVTIYYLIAALLILILIGLFLLPLVAAFQIIAMIIASIETAHGKHFRYPLTIRFLR